jgi:hypothetical protein
VNYPGYPGDVMDFVAGDADAGINAMLSAWEVFTGFFSQGLPDSFNDLSGALANNP